MSHTQSDFTVQTNSALYSTFGELTRIIPKVVKARYPILLRGSHGIGKSEFVQSLIPAIQKIMELERPPVLLDRRLSQCADAGDIIGIPVTDGRVTHHKPMEWFAQACDEPCIVFADEIDRAMMDVRQAFFEVGDSRKLHGHYLHEKTVIFSACNGSEHNDGTYQVTNFDPAELSRWWTIDIKPVVSDWVEWARKAQLHSSVIDFCNENPDFWFWQGDIHPNRIYPNPRSWTRLARTVSQEDLADTNNGLLLPLCAGFIGKEVAIKFLNYLETYSKIISSEEIIDYGRIHKVKNLNNLEILDLGRRIMARQDMKAGVLSDVQMANFAAFLQAIPAENFAKVWNEYCMNLGEPGVRRLKPLLSGGFLHRVYTGELLLEK